MASKSERVRFPGTGGASLAARIERPAGSPRAWALFAHCFTCSKDLESVHRLSRSLVEEGIAVLRFDFTGIGESEGDFAETNFSSNLDDLEAAAAYLAEQHESPRILIGHSLGGAAVLAVAPRLEGVVAVATIGAPSDPAHLRSTVLADVDLDRQEEAEVSIAGRSFRIRRQLFDDLAEQRLLDSLAELDRALLILHSPVDEVVGIDHARKLFDAARHPKSFVALDGADHLLLEDPGTAVWAGKVLASWASRYLPEPAARGDRDGEAAANGELEAGEVEVRSGHGFAQEVRTAHHRLAADEPEEAGGGDTGPNPYELLLASLGTCTSMTLRLYADRKGWPLEGAVVRLRHDRVHAKDCEDCEAKDGKVDVIERHLELAGDLDDEQRARLAEIAARCPVHKTLTSETRIRDV
jgi:putative redox protein